MAELIAFPNASACPHNIDPSMIDPPGLIASAPNARAIIVELEHEIADLNSHIAFQSRTIGKYNPLRVKTRTLLFISAAFTLGWLLDPPLGDVVAIVFHPSTATASAASSDNLLDVSTVGPRAKRQFNI